MKQPRQKPRETASARPTAPRLANRPPAASSFATPAFGLARVLSKLGFCSRNQAWELIRAGRVRVNGVVVRDGEFRTHLASDRVEVDGAGVRPAGRVYLMLHKPRGLVTTASDEQGRATIYACLAGAGLPFLSPVGRLDQASEGLLLLTNDTAWAARLTDPRAHVAKLYHVQVNAAAGAELCDRLVAGVEDAGEPLRAASARVLRTGKRNSWLEITLTEGRNRHLRRLLGALGLETLRLVRVAVGGLELGDLAKGRWRHLTPGEVALLGGHATNR